MSDSEKNSANSEPACIDDEYRAGYAFETGIGNDQNYYRAEIHYRNSNCPASNYRIGCLIKNRHIDGTPNRAFKCFNKSALKGYCPAVFELAECYIRGFGTNRDISKAFELLLKTYRDETSHELKNRIIDKIQTLPDSLEIESPEKEFIIGMVKEALSNDRNYNEAASYYKAAGDRGQKDAIFRMGVLNEIENKPESAINWYSKLFNSDYPQSLIRLGILCFKGIGTKTDVNLAFKFFKKAADLGEPHGALWSAIMIECGISTEYGSSESVELYESAYNNGIKTAALFLGLLFRNNNSGIPKNLVKAHEWFLKATKNGDGRALYELGKMYENGIGVPKDISKARKLYGQANSFGCSVLNGTTTPLDYQQFLIDNIQENYYLYINSFSLFDSCQMPNDPDEDETISKDMIPIDNTDNNLPQITETPPALLKRLSDAMNIGGPNAKIAREEVAYLFESCFGLDSDFDEMYRLYIIALSDRKLSDIQQTIALMMSDKRSPIYNMEKAYYWFKRSFDNNNPESALYIGDYYLNGISPASKNILTAAIWYLKAIKNRSQFIRVESRFYDMLEYIKKNKDFDSCVSIAYSLDKSNNADHQMTILYYTTALENNRFEVSTQLWNYLQHNRIKYNNEPLLKKSLEQKANKNDAEAIVICQYLGIPYHTEHAINLKNQQPPQHTSNQSHKIDQFIDLEYEINYLREQQIISIAQTIKLFPDLSYSGDIYFKQRCENCIKEIIKNPNIGIDCLSTIFLEKSSIIKQTYSQYSEYNKLDAIYHFANELYDSIPCYIATTLIANVASMGQKDALKLCTHKIIVENTENVDLAVKLLKQSTNNNNPEAMYKLLFQKEDNLTVKTGASNLFKNTDERDGYTRAT